MYVILRILSTIPTLLGVTVFAFLMVHLAPGDPLSVLTGGRVSENVLQELRAFYGFDLPLPVQYMHWLRNVMTGDFGTSFMSGRDVGQELFSAFSNSLKITVLAAPLAVLGGWTFGTIAAFHGSTGLGRGLSVVLGSFVSVPSYWLGMLLVAFFGVFLNWLPVMGMGPAASWNGWFSTEGLSYVLLPTITVIITPIGILARSTKAAIEMIMDHDFPDALRARGLPERYVRRRIERSALPGLIPIYALQLSYMFSALILIEAIFAWPGLGGFLTLAITARDMPSIQAGILLSALIFVVFNLIADLLQAGLDGRARP